MAKNPAIFYQRIAKDGRSWPPLLELINRVEELDPTLPIIVHCKSGARSARAIGLLLLRTALRADP